MVTLGLGGENLSWIHVCRITQEIRYARRPLFAAYIGIEPVLRLTLSEDESISDLRALG